MFTLNTKKNIELTPTENCEIIDYANKCDIDINGVLFMRNRGLSWRTNVACFSLLYRNTIFFCSDVSIHKAFPAIAHELKHREQLQRMGWTRYIALSNPLIRRWTIEPEAYAEQDRVELELRGF